MARVFLRISRTSGLVIALVLTVCFGNTHAAAPNQSPLPFETAIRVIFNELVDEVRKDLGNTTGPEEMVIVIDLFADEDSGEIPQVSQRIRSIMLDEATRRFFDFSVARLTLNESRKADYVISGSIHLGATEARDITIYRVSAAIIDAWNMSIMAKSRQWVSDPALDYTPLAIYRDNPFFNPAYAKRNDMPEAGAATLPAPHLIYSLETLALLRDAALAYERKNYHAAGSLFTKAAARPDGQTLWTQTGLYLANIRLGRLSRANEAFTRVIDIGVETYGMITVRFLFQKNSVDFWRDEAAKKRYETWIHRIGEYFSRRNDCLHIVGHSSNSGPQPWNEQLSVLRAEKIRDLLKHSLPNVKVRSVAIGMGSRENVVGIGTDDQRDALDRRVEIIPVACDQMGAD